VKPVEISWGVPNNRTISAITGPFKFTILSGHVREILLFNKFFLIVDTGLNCKAID